MTRNWDIIEQGDWVVIKMPSGNQKLIQLLSNVQIELGKFGKFQSSELLGKYYSVPLEIYDRDKLKRVENTDYLLDFEIDPRVETDATNQQIFDDANSQKLTQKDIEEMKLKSLDGSVHHQTIIKEIVSNNEKFNEKTEFAKAKYIKRKVKKYSKIFIPLFPNARNLIEYHNLKNPEKIHELRIDSLSQILTFANVRAGGRMLVCDDTGGLLGTAILERTHGHGTCYFFHDGQNASLEIMKCSNFSSEVLSSFKTFAYQNIGKQPELREIDEGVEVKPELVAKITARNANIKETYETLENGGFDSLIISSKFDTTEVIKKLEPFLAPSAIVVAYSARKELILEAYEYCRKSPSYANTFLTESWLREYQVPVFTSGTHPNMMMSGSGGFIFSATTVTTPEGLVIDKTTKRRKTNKN
ncbi:tRNA (adenine(58)-N(1))-methyltransferase non-catalytic subunit trm6 [Boothiomyces sp. JEL0866]|nr:tRNA (adenine(58)-N(1))-methyltransferase non-catalytic subunit trm6 [Boothiomyces sp. JEL0866]